MPVRIRFRTDPAHEAHDQSRRARGLPSLYHHDHEIPATPPAAPGDTWRVHWYSETAPDHSGPIAGYDICCIKCLEVHAWTTALNCASRRELPSGAVVCDHSGKGSCWVWTGNAEEGTLNASPSLHSVVEKGGCGYHGFLTAGILSDG